ncbi:hypothetical protein CFP56_027639 [Quercus suber]|uniref:Zinc knuckle CX2CX4HX4C domain-containing protein n=1 Tax=Quercus suber TaxID=58331 RepID=A0AAW0JWN1_QUESU
MEKNESEENLRENGSNVGEVFEVNVVGDEGGVWKRFTHIKVEVKVSLPLCPGVFLPRANLEDLWTNLNYEKLADVCYKCGRISHDEQFCLEEEFVLFNNHGLRLNTAGPWL